MDESVWGRRPSDRKVNLQSVTDSLFSTVANELVNSKWEFDGLEVTNAVPSGGKLIVEFTDGTVILIERTSNWDIHEGVRSASGE